MNVFLVAVLAIAFPMTMLIAPVAWVYVIVFSFKTIANRKPHIDLWRDAPMRNPWNIMLDSNLLTDEGLRCRAVAMKALAWFTIPILLVLTLAAAAGKLN